MKQNNKEKFVCNKFMAACDHTDVLNDYKIKYNTVCSEWH